MLIRPEDQGMEQVLQNINRLNRNLESVIAVGNEFGSVEALWSQFENFMGRAREEVEESNSRPKEERHDEGHNEGHEHQ
ncbi:DASH complex subunit Dad1-domain-containing protein [Aspergillus heterothallicus]